jgi:hypothetical protein
MHVDVLPPGRSGDPLPCVDVFVGLPEPPCPGAVLRLDDAGRGGAVGPVVEPGNRRLVCEMSEPLFLLLRNLKAVPGQTVQSPQAL